MNLSLIYKGCDITSKVGISQANIIDSAGGCLDSVEVAFTDTSGEWSRWAPQIDDVIRLKVDGFDSGDCFVDQIAQHRGQYILRGLSVPAGAKQPKTRSWEKVTLLQLGLDVASALGFTLSLYDVEDQSYDWADQIEKTDLQFLYERCEMEGLSLKVNNRKLILYSQTAFEQKSAVRTISSTDFFGTHDFISARQGTYCAATVSYGDISGSFVAAGRTGETIGKTIYVTSVGEAERFAKNLLRSCNKNENRLNGRIKLDPTLAAGSMVRVSGIGTADGLYMIDRVEHRVAEQQSALQLRKRLEGY